MNILTAWRRATRRARGQHALACIRRERLHKRALTPKPGKWIERRADT